VAIIGAGMAGLNAAVQLKRAGIPFVCIEKNGEVGGTWRENRYPGVRLDTHSRSYFHTFGVGFPSPGPYSVQAHNERYVQWAAKTFDLEQNVMFDTEVKSMIWDDAEKLWTIHARTAEGERTLRVQAVISAVGFLSRPNIPDISGAASFRGLRIHTAKWPADLDFSGKRIAVIGSGATSYQMVPELAKQAGHLDLFQREPSWCFEAPGYLSPYPPQVNWLDRNFPYLANMLRFRTSWNFRPDVTLRRITIDPEFRDEHAVSPTNKTIRDSCLAFMRRKLGDREDLIGKMIPKSPPFSSRPVLVDSNDNIYDALLRENVALVTQGIECIVPEGIRTVDGTVHEADIIVFATGYRANDFLWPMEIRGRNGASCEDLWARDGARAYLGTMIPDFPNFFMVYGPNMNSFGIGLGIIELEEMVTRFSVNCLGGLLEQGLRSVDVCAEAFDRYNALLDRHESRRVWSDPRSTSYYQNEHGRSACNCPFDIRLLWQWLRDPTGTGDSGSTMADPAVRPWFGADLVAS
jgi:4-hydroxyacetophenone monooxygenase